MVPISYKDILLRLGGLDAWLEKLGIGQGRHDRIHWAIDVLHRIVDLEKRDGLPAGVSLLDCYVAALDALEIHDIMNAFEGEPASVLAPKLERILSGSRLPSDETKRNSQARNTMFELALAAGWRSRGLNVCIGEPDITLRLADVTFLVECKRPFAEHGIRANIRDAFSQLKTKLGRPGKSTSTGIAAVSVSRIFNPGDRIFYSPAKAGIANLEPLLRQLVDKHRPDWRRASHHPGIVAVLFHITTLAFIKGRISKLEFAMIVPLDLKSPSYQLLKKHLTPLYET